jgi:hypothetical protein
MASRHLTERSTMMTEQTAASFAASRYVTISKFLRLLQSLALGLGAWLAIQTTSRPARFSLHHFWLDARYNRSSKSCPHGAHRPG